MLTNLGIVENIDIDIERMLTREAFDDIASAHCR
jgi:hypothetical protein